MTYPERIGVLVASKLSVEVSPSVLEAEPYGDDYDRGFDVGVDHSFRSVSGGTHRDGLTVMLEAGHTCLRVDDVDVGFSGVRYFPTDYEDERRHVEDAKVDFVYPDGSAIDAEVAGSRHPTIDARVRDLVDGFDDGTIVPIPNPED